MTPNVTPVVAALVTLLVPSLGLLWAAQTTGPTPPPLMIPSLYGRDLFEHYCAPCHGRDGKGGGPVANALKTPPPDLTTLVRRHGGEFPRGWVTVSVIGDDKGVLTPSHGKSDMPVWGPIFRFLDADEKVLKVRLANLIAHVESIQVK